MADWPTFTLPARPSITPFHDESLGVPIAAIASSSPASAAWVTAQTGLYVPFVIAEPVLCKKLFWYNGATASGNVCVAVYTDDGKRLVTTGSTAQATINVIQEVDVTDTLIPAGRNWMALAGGATTLTFFSIAPTLAMLRALGCYTQATLGTSPALPDPAVWVSPATAEKIPIFGLLNGPVP